MLLLLSGCSNTNQNQNETAEQSKQIPSADEMFTERDRTVAYDGETAISVNLSELGSVQGSDNLSVSENTLTIKKEGTYILSGSLSDGVVLVDALPAAKIQIVLNGVNITNSKTAPIYVKQAEKVVFTLAEGSENTISASGSFENDTDVNIDGALFCKQDITINGSGKLTVLSNEGHGIVAKDDFAMLGGIVDITSARHGIDANDSARIGGGTLTVSCGKDGVHAENTEDTNLGFIYIEGGVINITDCYEGIEALDIMICGGDINICAEDDGLNAAGGSDTDDFDNADIMRPQKPEGMQNPEQSDGGGKQYGGMMRPDFEKGERPEGMQIPTDDKSDRAQGFGGGMKGGFSSSSNGSITISGGSIYIKASGDGIDANGTLDITGGSVTVCGPTRGDTATLDYDKSATISGGSFIGTGGAGMAQSFSDAKQGLIFLKVGNISEKTPVILTDKNGKELINYTPELDYAVVILSSPEIVSGESYTIKIGENTQQVTAT